MIDERRQELASLYAFDLLAGAERVQFEAELARDSELQALVMELRQTSSQIAHAVPAATPPAELKQRILTSVENRRVSPTAAEVVAFPPRSPIAAVVPWAVAAGFALCAGWYGSRYYLARSENGLLRSEHELALVTLKTVETKLEAERLASTQLGADLVNLHATSKRELAQSAAARAEVERQLASSHHEQEELSAQLAAARKSAASAQAELTAVNDRLRRENDLAHLKIATLASMLGNSPKAQAVAVWDPAQQQGVFTVDQLPANASDQRYELWVIDQVPVSAGVFSVGPDGRAKLEFKPAHPVRTAVKFAVSREKNDGQSFHAAPSEVVMLSGDL